MVFVAINTHESDAEIISKFFIHLMQRSHALALHLAVKILLQIFLYEDLSVNIHTSVSSYFPPECQQDRTLLRNQYY